MHNQILQGLPHSSQKHTQKPLQKPKASKYDLFNRYLELKLYHKITSAGNLNSYYKTFTPINHSNFKTSKHNSSYYENVGLINVHEFDDGNPVFRLLTIDENPNSHPGLTKPVPVPYFACMKCGLEIRKFAAFAFKTVDQTETVVWHNSSKVRLVAEHASKCGKVDDGLAFHGNTYNTCSQAGKIPSLASLPTLLNDFNSKTKPETKVDTQKIHKSIPNPNLEEYMRKISNLYCSNPSIGLENATNFHNGLLQVLKRPNLNLQQLDNSFSKETLVKSIQNSAIRNSKIVVDFTRKMVSSEENGISSIVYTNDSNNPTTRVISANVVSKTFDIYNYPICFLTSQNFSTKEQFYQLNYKAMCDPEELDLDVDMLGGIQREIYSTCEVEISDFYLSKKHNRFDKYIIKNQGCFRHCIVVADNLAGIILVDLPELNEEKSKYLGMVRKNINSFIELTETNEVNTHLGIDQSIKLMNACDKIRKIYIEKSGITDVETCSDAVCRFIDMFTCEFKNRIEPWYSNNMLILANYGSKRSEKLSAAFRESIFYEDTLKHELYMNYRDNETLTSEPVSKKPKKSEEEEEYVLFTNSSDEETEETANEQKSDDDSISVKINQEIKNFESVTFTREDSKNPRERWQVLEKQGLTKKFPTITKIVRQAFSVPLGTNIAERALASFEEIRSGSKEPFHSGVLMSIAYNKSVDELNFVRNCEKILPDIDVKEFEAEFKAEIGAEVDAESVGELDI